MPQDKNNEKSEKTADKTLGELRQLRGVQKRSLTLLDQWLHSSGSTATFFDLEARLTHLDDIGSKFASIQEQIEVLDEAECIPDAGKLTEREDFNERFMNIKSKLLQYKHVQALETTMNESANEGNRSLIVDVNNSQLPPMDLPIFNGDYLEFPAFIDAFKTLIHNNHSRGMTDVRKFGLLKKYLGPEVQKNLRYFTMTADNYKACLETLEKRYAKKRLIFEKFLSELCRLPVAKNTQGLRAISDNTFGILKAVELLATESEIKDGLLIHLVLQKCDELTIKKWEEKIALDSSLPAWTEFTEFLENRCTTLECVEFATHNVHQKAENRTKAVDNKLAKPKPQIGRGLMANNSTGCVICGGTCAEFAKCKAFMDLDPRDRYKLIKKKNRCAKCLQPDHADCTAICQLCSKTHHQLLHFGNRGDRKEDGFKACVAHGSLQVGTTILATVRLLVRASNGTYVSCRALLDGGSQVNFISGNLAKILYLPRFSSDVNVVGIHGQGRVYRKATEVHFKSAINNFEGQFVAVVSNELDGYYPHTFIDTRNLHLRNDVKLADPNFNKPAKIDLILSAGVFYPSLGIGQIKLKAGNLVMQKTLFGWIVAGDFDAKASNSYPIIKSLSAKASVGANLEWLSRFWELEEVPVPKPWSPIEQQCERHFLQTMRRNTEGRFVVRLPFAKDPSLLGSSFNMAKTRLVSTENKLRKNPLHLAAYNDFINEYEQLNHLEVLGPPHQYSYVNLLPHFFVENANSSTTPLRVVFDASAKTASGYSLNDLLMVGPVLQPDLFSHLITLRSHFIAMVADITKMYRQVEVAEEDRKYQCILWRDSAGELTVLQLRTVTYGTATASYIAQRCLLYLADNEPGYPLGSKILRDNFLMDDMVTGACQIDEAAEIFKQTQSLLKLGGFHLRKLMSNSNELLSKFDAADVREVLEIGDKSVTNALGLHWAPSLDKFLFRAQSQKGKLTKRGILSETARQFDPLGLIQPVIIIAKIIIQELWSLKIDWDESVPQSIATQWTQWTDELSQLNELSVPRHVLATQPTVIEYHGFADASERAYAACIYVRSIGAEGNIAVHLLCSKSRVAPLRTVSLPRLELCACLLLAELFTAVQRNNSMEATRFIFWTDSTTALKWVVSSPHRWQSFVATRVTKIQNLTGKGEWRHVPGILNPADIPTRGAMPSALQNNVLWWNGPGFLFESESNWPGQPSLPDDDTMPEIKDRKLAWSTVVAPDSVSNCKFQSWPALRRVFSYAALFINNARRKARERKQGKISPSKPKEETLSTKLSVDDLEHGTTLMIKCVQHANFIDVVNARENSNDLPKNHFLLSLNPFLDKENVLRVGGRLANATGLSYNTQHPIILPKQHSLTKSLFIWEHVKRNHVGPQALLANVRLRFWPLGGKVEANKTVYNCVTCRKSRPVTFQQVMGNLPADRLVPTRRPFTRTGVDFGYLGWIHYKGRGTRPTLTYLAVFVCFTTKAVHLELVEDLTTAAFINALKRFVAIRGAPEVIWSDNATNFVGASRLLQDLRDNYANPQHWEAVYEWCRDSHGIDWQFIPPRSPHWGGLWEAAVKSSKHLLQKAIGSAHLHIWEMLTVIAEVSAVLNSRPLIPLTMNPDDEQPLTPGHFLVGGPLTALPEPNFEDEAHTYRERWQVVTAIKQHFWKRWSTEYLQTLQQRYKWKKPDLQPRLGDIVLLVDTNIPSRRWSLGRIIELYAGRDGFARVADVRTETGTYKRGITELCPLPVEHD